MRMGSPTGTPITTITTKFINRLSVTSVLTIAFVVCAIAIGSVAICWAEGGSRIPTSGGPYGYIETAFGPLAGYIAGTILWFD
jgi:amino acid transporter